MIRIFRNAWGARLAMMLGVGLAFAAVGTACKKDDKKADSATGDKGDKAADKAGKGDKTSDNKPGVMPKETSDDLSLIPLDSELVLGLNFAQLQQSALWKQFVEPKLTGSNEMTKSSSLWPAISFASMSTTLPTPWVG